MQKITPFLWFEKDMAGVAAYYQSVFPGVVVKAGGELSDTPSGSVQMATLEIFGFNIDLMTAGPYLPFNATVSFLISCESAEEVDDLASRLVGGTTMMELGEYPFAERYTWITDRYGVSWQLMFSSKMAQTQKVMPVLMFSINMCGRAEEAARFYTSVFHNATLHYLEKYAAGESGNEKAVVKHAGFTLENVNMAVMDNGTTPASFTFAQAVSFIISCENQAEIDYYWEKLTDGGTEIQCGWLNDKFGFPWQVVPSAMGRMMSTGTKEQIGRVTTAFMQMKKFDIATLDRAFAGE
jgi:predicted 3-demethylubiquinone-9 3-methyltransferase (glyoxalase superfamily)